MGSLVTTEQLYDWFGCKRQSKLVKLLRENNISFKHNAHGQPITTIEAINDSLRGKKIEREIEF